MFQSGSAARYQKFFNRVRHDSPCICPVFALYLRENAVKTVVFYLFRVAHLALFGTTCHVFREALSPAGGGEAFFKKAPQTWFLWTASGSVSLKGGGTA